MRVLTSDTPLSAIMLIDISNDWTNDKTGDLATGIESTQSSTGGIIEVLLPGWEGLQTRDDVSFVCTVSTDGILHHLIIGLHPLRIRPTQRILKKLVVNSEVQDM